MSYVACNAILGLGAGYFLHSPSNNVPVPVMSVPTANSVFGRLTNGSFAAIIVTRCPHDTHGTTLIGPIAR